MTDILGSCTVAQESTRREFLQTIAGAAALGAGLAVAPLRAAEPITRTGKPYMKLSLAAYSFHRSLPRAWTPEQIQPDTMTLDHFVRYCADLDLDGAELTSYYFPKEVTAEYLNHLKELTFRLGLDVSGTAVGNDFCVAPGPERDEQLAQMTMWIDHAATLGAPVIRIFAGQIPKGDTEEAALERCVEGINSSLNYAAERGVILALENHGGITATADQILRIVERVKPSPWFGVNFDSGNFETPDPYGDLARIAPYAVNAQLKVSISHRTKEPADLGRIVGILRDAGYRGYVVLEYEEDEEPKSAIPRHIDTLRKLIRG
jgi:sugar phosphate isomerase/epimerase